MNDEKKEGVTDTIGAVSAGVGAAIKYKVEPMDISNFGKHLLKSTTKPVDVILNIHSISGAKSERELFNEIYQIGFSSVGAGAVGLLCSKGGPIIAGYCAMGGNYLGGKIAELTDDWAYEFYDFVDDYVYEVYDFIFQSFDSFDFSSTSKEMQYMDNKATKIPTFSGFKDALE